MASKALGRNKGVGVLPGLLPWWENFPLGLLPTLESLVLIGLGPNFGQPLWGALPPKSKGGGAHMVLSGNFWNLLEASRAFHDLPGPAGTILGHSGMVSGHSGTFWNTSKTFRDRFRTFRNYLDRFRDDPGYGLACSMPCVGSSVVFGTSTD